jgi:hypothetical protein
LGVDVFSNTPGMAAAALTFTGFLQPTLLELFVPRDAADNLRSSAATLGFSKFMVMSLVLVFVHCLLFFTLESFGFFNWLQWLFNIVGSTLLTLVVLMAIESVRQ